MNVMQLTKKVFALVFVLVCGFPVAASAIANPDPVHSRSVPPAVVALHMYADDDMEGGTQFCSGTLVAPLWVLTAAHCAEYDDPDYVSTLVEGRRVSTEVERAVVHPGYRSTDNGIINDAALLRLVAPLPGVEPVAVGSVNDHADLSYEAGLVVYGWGYAFRGTPGTETNKPGYLIMGGGKYKLPLLPKRPRGVKQYVDNNPHIEYNPRFHIATKYVSDGLMMGSCSGDSGGPVVSYRTGKPRVVGLVSYGDIECLKPVAGVNTRVASVAKWIRATMGR